MDKRQLRKQIKEQRVDGADRASFSYAACMRALTHPAYARARTILCYAALYDELNVDAFVQAARLCGKRVAFPVCLEEFCMQAWEPLNEGAWETGAYGIRTPSAKNSLLIAPGDIDFILVPGLAFDTQGGRLGRGAGFYDRYFAHAHAFRMGICMDIQIVHSLPMEPHDIFMHAVTTNTRCFW